MGLAIEYLAARFTSGHFLLTGRRLRPFCLDYLEQLEALGSPLIEHGRPITLDDLRVAAMVCSRPLGQGIHRVGSFFSWLGWRLTRRLYSVDIESDRWHAYLRDNYTTPEVWKKPIAPGESPREVASPWTLTLEQKLLRAGYPLPYVRSMPLGLAVWRALALSESEGGARPMTDFEKSILAMLDGKEAADV